MSKDTKKGKDQKSETKPVEAPAAPGDSFEIAAQKAAMDVVSSAKPLEAAAEGLAEAYKVSVEEAREAIDKASAPMLASRQAAEAKRKAEDAANDARKKAVAAQQAAAAVDGRVIVQVPKRFKLNDGKVVHDYSAGTYPMLKEHAEHPYSKANGVKIHS